MRIQLVSKCYYCEQRDMKIMTHLFVTASIVQKLWKQFASCAGIKIEGLQLQQLIIKWWKHKANNKLNHVLKAVAAVLIWELWKRRNAKRHGKEYSFTCMNHQCQMIIHQLIRVKFPSIKEVPYQWKGMVDQLQNYKPTLYYHLVDWKLPEEGWIKCNTDGFCIRNNTGELLYAEAQDIGVTTNMDEESMAIWKALMFCLSQDYQQVSLETDSLTLKKLLIRNWRIPLELVERVEVIQEIMSQMNVTINHILRKQRRTHMHP